MELGPTLLSGQESTPRTSGESRRAASIVDRRRPSGIEKIHALDDRRQDPRIAATNPEMSPTSSWPLLLKSP